MLVDLTLLAVSVCRKPVPFSCNERSAIATVLSLASGRSV
jgi:hypothetical protein